MSFLSSPSDSCNATKDGERILMSASDHRQEQNAGASEGSWLHAHSDGSIWESGHQSLNNLKGKNRHRKPTGIGNA